MAMTDGGEIADAAGESRWRRVRRRLSSASSETDRLHYSGLGERVEKILRLAEQEARDLRDEAVRAAAAIIQAAERDADRIRSEAEADARAARAAAGKGPVNQ